MKDKRRMRMASLAGLEATLRKGRMMDEEHNQKPVPSMLYVPEVEKMREVIRNPPAGAITAAKEEKKVEPVSQEDKQEPAKKDAIPAKKTNITLSEIQQIKARLLELERLETENQT